MKYQILENKKNVVTMEITVDKKEWDEAVENAYQTTKGKYNIEGFRKGKAPRKVIENMYGPNVFVEEALTNTFEKHYLDIMNKEKDIEPIDAPNIRVKSLDEKGLVIEAKIPVMPEVTLGEYKGLGINVKAKEVSKKQIEDEVKRVQAEQARLVETKEASKLGNIVNIDFEGFVDGVAFQGGKGEGYDLELGSHGFIDTFEDQLVGHKEGDEVDVNVTFPAEYHAEELKGKPALFKVKVNAVKEKQLPEINDALASDVSEFETLEEWKNHIKEHLTEHAVKNARIETENKIIDAIVQKSKMELPEVLVDNELDNLMHDLEYRLMYQGLRLEDYAKYLNVTVDELKQQRRKEAEKACKVRLVMSEILKKEKMTVKDSEVNTQLKEMAEKAGQKLEDYKAQVDNERIAYIKNNILLEKLLNFLVENNK